MNKSKLTRRRILRALIERRTSVKAVRFPHNPSPDRKEDDS